MDFIEDIRARVLLFDGAYGTLLQTQATGESPALLNMARPMDLLDLHTAYLKAGATILTANTASANSILLQPFGLEKRMEELVQSGVALCREAIAETGGKAYVAAAIGPTGRLYSESPETPAQLYHAYVAQCAAAEAAGANLLYIQTMHDICEARLALLAARAATKLPVLCAFTLEEDGNTHAGNPPEVLAHFCAKIGAAVCGINCGLGPAALFDGYSRLAGASIIPTLSVPNSEGPAGEPLSPEAMADAMAPYLHTGASAIGACCKSTPAHTAALRRLIDTFHGHARTAAHTGEFISAPRKRLPRSATEPHTILSLAGLSHEEALARLRELAGTVSVLHIDFADWGTEAISRLLFYAIPHTAAVPLAFHLHSAKQANAALLAYPGIAAVYAHSDTYRVLKAAVRYGAEVIS